MAGKTESGCAVRIAVYNNPSKLPIIEWFNTQRDYPTLSFQNLIIDGIKGVSVTPLDGILLGYPNVFVSHGNKVYNISFLCTDLNQEKANLDVFYYILNNFKFTQ